jgi:hypothetical protein
MKVVPFKLGGFIDVVAPGASGDLTDAVVDGEKGPTVTIYNLLDGSRSDGNAKYRLAQLLDIVTKFPQGFQSRSRSKRWAFPGHYHE